MPVSDGFWRLRFDSSCGLSYAMPSSSCSFLHIRSWRGPSAKSNKSKISGISESRSRNWLERIVHAAALKTPQSQIGMVLKDKAYNLTKYPCKDSNLFP